MESPGSGITAGGTSLSQGQFGSVQPAQAQQATAPNPTANLFTQVPALPGPPQSLNMQPHQPHYLTEGTGSPAAIKGADAAAHLPESPLPTMASSYGSVKTAAAWRQPPGRVLPLAKGTFGSVFNPFGE